MSDFNLVSFAQKLEDQRRGKRDFRAQSAAIVPRVSEAGVVELELDDVGRFGLTRTAETQLRELAGIPAPYYDRCRKEAPALLQTQLERWVTRGDHGPRLVRTLDGRARAVLSPQYRPLDNYDLATSILPVLASTGLSIKDANISDDYLHLRVVSERITVDVKKGDPVQSGFVVRNSEVGKGALAVEELIWRLVCLNGAIFGSVLKKAHFGRAADAFGEGVQEYLQDATRRANDAAFFATVRDVVTGLVTVERTERLVAQLRKTAETAVQADPAKVVEAIAETVELTQVEQSSVLRHLIEGGDLTQWGYVNAVTAAAHDAEEYDRSIELQRAGARVVQLSAHDLEAHAKRLAA